MKKRIFIFLTAALIMTAGCAACQKSGGGAALKGETKMQQKNGKLMGRLTTNMGAIEFELFEDKAPVTVDNFVGLATGVKEWVDPRSLMKQKKPFYNGLIFHRVIPEFMIQTGCPLGTGTGNPGYKFKDEFAPDLTFNIPGRLGMANAGANDNGSQFFITEIPTPWLDGKHTVFGQVTAGLDIVKKIARVPRDRRDKPLEPVVIQNVEIFRQ